MKQKNISILKIANWINSIRNGRLFYTLAFEMTSESAIDFSRCQTNAIIKKNVIRPNLQRRREESVHSFVEESVANRHQPERLRYTNPIGRGNQR